MTATPGPMTEPRANQATGMEPRKPGRPSVYTPELADLIAQHYAQGMPIQAIAALEGMPDRATILRWKAEDRGGFATTLARAREERADALVAQGLRILDEVDPDEGNGSARVSKAREQSGYRRWMASCLDRDTYGERARVEVDARVQVVAAFVDLQTAGQAATAADAEVTVLPHVVAPDGAQGA